MPNQYSLRLRARQGRRMPRNAVAQQQQDHDPLCDIGHCTVDPDEEVTYDPSPRQSKIGIGPRVVHLLADQVPEGFEPLRVLPHALSALPSR